MSSVITSKINLTDFTTRSPYCRSQVRVSVEPISFRQVPAQFIAPWLITDGSHHFAPHGLNALWLALLHRSHSLPQLQDYCWWSFTVMSIFVPRLCVSSLRLWVEQKKNT